MKLLNLLISSFYLSDKRDCWKNKLLFFQFWETNINFLWSVEIRFSFKIWKKFESLFLSFILSSSINHFLDPYLSNGKKCWANSFPRAFFYLSFFLCRRPCFSFFLVSLLQSFFNSYLWFVICPSSEIYLTATSFWTSVDHHRNSLHPPNTIYFLQLKISYYLIFWKFFTFVFNIHQA